MGNPVKSPQYMGISNGENIYKWGMFGMFHCHALPKKPPRLGHAASVLFDPSLVAIQQRKAPFFSGQKVTLLLGFFLDLA